MILSVNIAEKSFGNKILYNDLKLDIQPGEKLGLVGRNGTGKSTLLNMITGQDKDFDGEIKSKKGLIIVGSRQEHHGFEDITSVAYILGDLPEYKKLKNILDTYPEKMGDNQRMQIAYSDALERFSQLGYFEAESQILEIFGAYQLSEDLADRTMDTLSGGQKRLIELVKVQRSRAHLALIDEPTNHMDYVAKNSFLKWFKSAKEAVVVITHDRDVLQAVDRIIEIRDGQAFSFPGNYDDYLKVNAVKITSEVNQFSLVQRRIANLKENIIRYRRLKERSRDPGTIQRFKSLEAKSKEELHQLESQEKPTFWIDRQSADNLNPKMNDAYNTHKTKNIRISTGKDQDSNGRLLVEVRGLSLGYGELLFEGVNFDLREGERIRLHGRNGAGKSTLVNAILGRQNSVIETFDGTIVKQPELGIGVYEQEIDPRFLDKTLHSAIEEVLLQKGAQASDQKIKRLLGDYLFNPQSDGDMLVSRLSGGQKARFQLISMLANEPRLLILDEPTNHLDLPSIEELEDALKSYKGAVLYISHDTYFAKNVGGETIEIK